jgi:hypothetical protein
LASGGVEQLEESPAPWRGSLSPFLGELRDLDPANGQLEQLDSLLQFLGVGSEMADAISWHALSALELGAEAVQLSY